MYSSTRNIKYLNIKETKRKTSKKYYWSSWYTVTLFVMASSWKSLTARDTIFIHTPEPCAVVKMRLHHKHRERNHNENSEWNERSPKKDLSCESVSRSFSPGKVRVKTWTSTSPIKVLRKWRKWLVAINLSVFQGRRKESRKREMGGPGEVLFLDRHGLYTDVNWWATPLYISQCGLPGLCHL